MRIALFTETYLPVINGVVTHVKALKEGLEIHGHKVLIVTADSNVKRHEIENNVMYCPAVKLKKIYNYDISSPLSAERLRLIKKFNPDIIHIHNEFGIGMSGILIAKTLKIPLVYTLHTMYDDYVYYVANKIFCKFVTGATHKYARALASASAAITGPSKKVEDFFHKCGVKKPVNVIPNPVETDSFNPDNFTPETRKEYREKFNFADDEVIFAFCGRLGKEKNISWLLEEWAKYVKPDDKIKLLIIGDGPFYEQHANEIKELGISGSVTLAGKVEHEKLPPYYTACDAYITASLSDTNSISMLEAMAMKLPVLHIRDELNTGQVVDGINGTIFNDGSEMYEKLIKIRDLPAEKRKEFGESARESIIHQANTALAENILGIYESVIKEYALKHVKNRLI
ncbi:MAG: glycosyltransferase [Oscillospiraceae bacterium]|nr:glycosyltransferase [Oscillospiraceae bacterium]